MSSIPFYLKGIPLTLTSSKDNLAETKKSDSAIVFGKITGLGPKVYDLAQGILFTKDGPYIYLGSGSVMDFCAKIKGEKWPAGIKFSAWSFREKEYFTIDSDRKGLKSIQIPTDAGKALLAKHLNGQAPKEEYELHGAYGCPYAIDACVICVEDEAVLFEQFCFTEYGKLWANMVGPLPEKANEDAQSSAHN